MVSSNIDSLVIFLDASPKHATAQVFDIPGRAVKPAAAAGGAKDMMTDGTMVIARENPLAEDLALLFQRHTADMHADTPPESIHMLPRADLDRPEIALFVLREAGRAVAMGAVKRIAPALGEIKSMHVLSEARGRGHSRRMLAALIDHARAEGMTRLSLETGVQPTFVAARALYARTGFVECGPFGDYRPDPNSVFMTLALAAD